MEFCKNCGMPFEGEVKPYECEQCKNKVDASCIKQVDEKMICHGCIRKKDEMKKRIEQNWQRRFSKE